MEKRYRALRMVAGFYKVLGGIVGVITILVVIILLASSLLGGAAMSSVTRQVGGNLGYGSLLTSVLGGLIASALAALYGGVVAVSLFVMGEGVYLLIAMEENTRATVALLQRPAGPPAS